MTSARSSLPWGLQQDCSVSGLESYPLKLRGRNSLCVLSCNQISFINQQTSNCNKPESLTSTPRLHQPQTSQWSGHNYRLRQPAEQNNWRSSLRRMLENSIILTTSCFGCRLAVACRLSLLDNEARLIDLQFNSSANQGLASGRQQACDLWTEDLLGLQLTNESTDFLVEAIC